MAKITIQEISRDCVKVTTELFAADQAMEELHRDYMWLISSLDGCAHGTCSGCIFCDRVMPDGKCCDDVLKNIAATELRRVVRNLPEIRRKESENE